MTNPLAGLTIASAWMTAGLAFGLVYFVVLRRTVQVYLAGQGRVVPAALTVCRFGAALLFLGFAVRFGALSLLAAFLGFLVARSLALRASRRMG